MPESSLSEILVGYLQDVVLPIVDALDRDSVEIVALPGAEAGEVVVRITGEGRAVAMLLGRQGRTADALRVLARACARTAGSGARIDVRVGGPVRRTALG